MTWERMTIDEYAELASKMGARLHKIDDVWWKEVRPFFFRPLFPFASFIPHSQKAPLSSFLVGFQHLVPTKEYANSNMHFLIFDDLRNYSIESLTHDYRKNIKKGLKNFQVKTISGPGELIDDGFAVYQSFYMRTHYYWKTERTNKKEFVKWVETLFSFPKLLLLGVYSQEHLQAVSVSYFVMNIIIYATYFSKTEALQGRSSELMLHAIRERAASCDGVNWIYMGSPGTKESLDYFKTSRGCKVISKPAYYRLNFVTHFLLKQFRKEDYKKLVGLHAAASH